MEAMVEKSEERVKREGLSDRVQCRVADVQELPFEDNLFDAVISESVTAFPEDKLKAVNEYVRVTKPGGYVGLNESTWLKVPPPPEMVAWVSQDVGATVQPLTSSEWAGLMENAGLKEIDVRTYGVKVKDETRGIIQRYGRGGMLKVYWRMLRLYMRNPDYREFVKEVRNIGIAPRDLDEYFGYGLYVGRK